MITRASAPTGKLDIPNGQTGGRPGNPVEQADNGRADGCQTHPSPSPKSGGDGNLLNQFKPTAFGHGWTQINTDKGENGPLTGLGLGVAHRSGGLRPRQFCVAPDGARGEDRIRGSHLHPWLSVFIRVHLWSKAVSGGPVSPLTGLGLRVAGRSGGLRPRLFCVAPDGAKGPRARTESGKAVARSRMPWRFLAVLGVSWRLGGKALAVITGYPANPLP